MLKNNFKTLMVLIVLISSFSNYTVPGCMDSLITNPFVKLSLIYFSVYSFLNNHRTSLYISILLFFVMENEDNKLNKPIDENESAEIILEKEIKELEKEVNNNKDEISKELEKIESELENEVIEEEESNITEESEKLVDQQIKEVINIKSSRGMKDNCEECNFIKKDDYNIKIEDLSGYDNNEYFNLN
jgi:isoleucyl-tRNA synthetase